MWQLILDVCEKGAASSLSMGIQQKSARHRFLLTYVEDISLDAASCQAAVLLAVEMSAICVYNGEWCMQFVAYGRVRR